MPELVVGRSFGVISYLGSLLEGLFIHGNQKDCMGARTILRRRLYIFDQVLACGEVAERGSTQLFAHFFLFLSGINGNHPQSHRFCVLTCQGTQSTSSANDSDSLARPGTRLLQAFVDCDACTEDGSNFIEWYLFGDPSYVGGFSDGVLLECTVNGVAGEEGFGAERFVALHAEAAGEAGTVEPLHKDMMSETGASRMEMGMNYLDSGMVPNLNVSDQISSCNNHTGTLMTTDQGQFGRDRPVTVDSVQVGMADTRVFDIDEDFVRARFCNCRMDQPSRSEEEWY